MMKKIPTANDSYVTELICTVCLLPMQYQTKQNGKFLWQCFKCGKKYLVSISTNDEIEESWSPPK